MKIKAAIVDFGLGNLYSVKSACEYAGMTAETTHSKRAVKEADIVILPGVGAFGDAMATLKKLDLISVLLDVAASGKPLFGICLGMQLLMSESFEFGKHKGLGIIPGSVVMLERKENVKVPHISWEGIYRNNGTTAYRDSDVWQGTALEGLPDGNPMYFVHSYHVVPENQEVILCTSHFGGEKFCSGLRFRNIFAFQFHPERSGAEGLRVYQNFKAILERNKA